LRIFPHISILLLTGSKLTKLTITANSQNQLRYFKCVTAPSFKDSSKSLSFPAKLTHFEVISALLISYLLLLYHIMARLAQHFSVGGGVPTALRGLLGCEVVNSKSETVKSQYFPYKIAPLISFSGAILKGKQWIFTESQWLSLFQISSVMIGKRKWEEKGGEEENKLKAVFFIFIFVWKRWWPLLGSSAARRLWVRHAPDHVSLLICLTLLLSFRPYEKDKEKLLWCCFQFKKNYTERERRA